MSSLFGGSKAVVPTGTAVAPGAADSAKQIPFVGGTISQMAGEMSPTMPTAPTPAPPPNMPSIYDPAAIEAARLAQAKALTSGGRTSTILTTPAGRSRNTIAGGTTGRTGSSPGVAALGTS